VSAIEANPVAGDTARPLSLEFSGDAREYFRIWIVNLCLTLLTLGLFSAWAKVRKKRYLYSHTRLDGTPFQYLGQPLPILKGRLIAAALFVFYYAASHFFSALMPAVLIGGLLLAPWVLVRSAAFNARYSAYRNITFGFAGDYRGALATLYWLGLLPIAALGISWDWFGQPALAGLVFGLLGILFPWWLVRLRRFLFGGMRYGGQSGSLNITGRQLWGIYFRGGLLIGLGGAVGGILGALSASPLFALVAVYFGYLAGFAFIQAATSNLVWNNARLGMLRFVSSLRRRDMIWLYFSNAAAILLTCGLLIPWAVVRTLRYRAQHLAVLAEGELSAFVAGPADSVQAAGAEVSELFDLDLAL
jgi:uncharacterized membrane protein YjgN (DUF898 family)